MRELYSLKGLEKNEESTNDNYYYNPRARTSFLFDVLRLPFRSAVHCIQDGMEGWLVTG